jgi:FkbM family methyltransferase
MNQSINKWQKYINSQIDFYNKNGLTLRKDDEFIWDTFNPGLITVNFNKLKDFIKRNIKYNLERKWFNLNFELLFTTREILEDELSKFKFDLYLILKVVGHNKIFYPRTNFSDFLLINEESIFDSNLSANYGGFSLKKFNLTLQNKEGSHNKINVVTYIEFITLTNQWRQYFIKRDNVNFIPGEGDVVIDCGACLGDTAMLFLGCVGNKGQVHTFDPVPLHNRYIAYQLSLNPTLKDLVYINQLAVGDAIRKFEGAVDDVSSITAGGLTISNFEMTTIDEYCLANRIEKVDFIKMDIEGAELSALSGAARTIRNLKPKLAITAYHKDHDLWEIPTLIKKINPEYKIYFDHHLPIFWESCFYAQ